MKKLTKLNVLERLKSLYGESGNSEPFSELYAWRFSELTLKLSAQRIERLLEGKFQTFYGNY